MRQSTDLYIKNCPEGEFSLSFLCLVISQAYFSVALFYPPDDKCMVLPTQEWLLTRNISELLKYLDSFIDEEPQELLGKGDVPLTTKAGLSTAVSGVFTGN